MEKKFYQRNWFILLLLVFFFPVGLFLMWKYADWKKAIKIIVTVVVAIMFIYGVVSPPATNTSDTERAKATTEETQKPVKEDKKIEALKGKTCYDSETLLKELGYTGTYTFETNSADFTGDIGAMSQEEQKGFIITSVKTIDKSDKKASFLINSTANMEKEKKESILREKLSESSSCVAINTYGQSQYPYGFSFSAFSATFTLADDNTWNVSGTCKVTNAYGTKAKLQCIATVTGTSENPTVTYFEVR